MISFKTFRLHQASPTVVQPILFWPVGLDQYGSDGDGDDDEDADDAGDRKPTDSDSGGDSPLPVSHRH